MDRAEATRLYDPSLSSCSAKNCSSVSLQVPFLNFGGDGNVPWVAEIYVGPDECVGLDTSSLGDRYMIIAVPPREGYDQFVDTFELMPGTLWADPLGKPTRFGFSGHHFDGSAGWYTIIIRPWRRSWSVPTAVPPEERLSISFGRYSKDNPNCKVVYGNPTGEP